MIAHKSKMIAQSVVGAAADAVEDILIDVLEHGYGEVNLKITVADSEVVIYRVNEEKTFKPSLN